MSWQNLTDTKLLASFAENAGTINAAEVKSHLSERDKIIAKYGQYGATYQANFCENWNVKSEFKWFPAKKIFLNKDFKKKLQVAFASLEQAGLHHEIKTFDGCLVERTARGLKAASLHCWALAIDLNAKENPIGGSVKFSPAFLRVMRQSGIYCGADWKRKDGMHFALYNG